jgi:hypothetical protein
VVSGFSFPSALKTTAPHKTGSQFPDFSGQMLIHRLGTEHGNKTALIYSK